MARTEKKPRPPKARAGIGAAETLEELFEACYGVPTADWQRMNESRCSVVLNKRISEATRNATFDSIVEARKVDVSVIKVLFAATIAGNGKGLALKLLGMEEQDKEPLVNDEEMAEGVRRLLEANDKPKQVVPIQTATIEQPPQAIPGDAEEWVG